MGAFNGYTRMPPLGTNEPDQENIQLLRDWINQEASALTTYTAWRIHHFGNDSSAEGEPDVDADFDGETNWKEWLALTNPRDMNDVLRVEVGLDGGNLEINIPGRPNRGFTIQRSTNLRDWFRWDVPGNDGIPRASGSDHVFMGPLVEPRAFFRFLMEER